MIIRDYPGEDQQCIQITDLRSLESEPTWSAEPETFHEQFLNFHLDEAGRDFKGVKLGINGKQNVLPSKPPLVRTFFVNYCYIA